MSNRYEPRLPGWDSRKPWPIITRLLL